MRYVRNHANKLRGLYNKINVIPDESKYIQIQNPQFQKGLFNGGVGCSPNNNDNIIVKNIVTIRKRLILKMNTK